MAIYINTLNGGNIIIGAGGSSGHADTWYKYANDTEWRTVSISGSIMSEGGPTTQIPNVTDVVALEIGTNVTSIGAEAFVDCDGLTSVTIPGSVTSIGNAAFNNCFGLTSVTIPDSVTSIGTWAFAYCSDLVSVTIPNSVTSIGSSAFEGCEGLTTVTITANGGNAETVKQKMIDAGVSPSVTWNMPEPTYHADTWYKYPGDTDWRTVSISGSINSEDVGIPTTQIPDVGRVAALEIGTDVTSIGSFAFVECNLTNVTIPDSVTSIGSVAFGSCNGLTSITVLGKTTAQAQTLLADANVPQGCTIVGELG